MDTERIPTAGSVALIRRAGWGIADQALSSLTNFALGILVARAVSPAGFGAFTIVFATYTVALGLCRAIASEPLLVRYSASPDSMWCRGTGPAAGAALLIGGALGLGCILVGWILRGQLWGPLVVLGLTLPGLLLQDCWRYAFLARGRASSAFGNDLVWALALFPALLLLQRGHPSVTLLTLAWGAGATVAALFGIHQARVTPVPLATFNWLREQRDLFPRFLGEFAVLAGAGQLVVYGLAALAGLAALGVFRAGYILFGPIQMLIMGIGWVAIPELVRTLQRSTRSLLWATTSLSLGLGAAALSWGAIVLLLPPSLGFPLLRTMWVPAHHLSVALTVSWIAGGVIAGAAAALRALAAAKGSLGARLVGSPLGVVGGLVGAAINGAAGAAWGLALAGWIEAFVWWRQFTRALRERERAVPAEASGRAHLFGGPPVISQECSS